MNAKKGYREVLKQKEYLKMILAAAINRFGDSVEAIAFSWIVFEITASASWAAIIYGINKLPTVFITPLAGAWVEGRNKKAIMVITDFMRALCVAFIATMYMTHNLNPYMIMVITLIISTVEAFRGPANTAFTPKVISSEHYEYGMALMSTVVGITELVGTGLAAIIIATVGTSGAIYIDMITFILSALIILTVRAKEEKMVSGHFDVREYLGNLRDGFSYVKNDKVVCFLFSTLIFMNGIFVPYNSLEAVMVSEILHGGPELLSVLGICVTTGMILGSILFPMINQKLSGKVILSMTCVATAFLYMGIPLGKVFYHNELLTILWIGILTFSIGLALSISNNYLNVAGVLLIKEDYLARISGISAALGAASVPVISFLVSMITTKVSTHNIFIGAGLLAVVEVIYIMTSKILPKKMISKESNSEEETEQETYGIPE